MKKISSKTFAAQVDDRIASECYDVLVRLMTEFEGKGLLRKLSPPEEAHILIDTEEAAEALKENVYNELVKLGLDVESDGRDY